MFCVGYGIYTGERSSTPACIFHNEHKTLYNLFSLDPAVSCVGGTQASHREIYRLCSNLLHFIQEYVISFLAMDTFRWDKWILLAAFF